MAAQSLIERLIPAMVVEQAVEPASKRSCVVPPTHGLPIGDFRCFSTDIEGKQEAARNARRRSAEEAHRAVDVAWAPRAAIYEQVADFYTRVHYASFMGMRPQTLAALSDSPIGLATFMLDHDARSLELIARSFDGVAEGLTPDDVLDNITLFWLTNTGVSISRLYWENKLAFFTPKGVKIPVAASAFPDELFQAPRSWTEQAYPNLVHYNRLPKGGHFAAWEQPKFLTEEIRAGFGFLRK